MAQVVRKDENLDWIDKIDPVKVYELLVLCAGAYGHERTQNHFVSCWKSDSGDWSEWRFEGSLGFGGKLWRHRAFVIKEGFVPALCVDCYQEHRNKKRQKIITKTNEELLKLLVDAGLRKQLKK